MTALEKAGYSPPHQAQGDQEHQKDSAATLAAGSLVGLCSTDSKRQPNQDQKNAHLYLPVFGGANVTLLAWAFFGEKAGAACLFLPFVYLTCVAGDCVAKWHRDRDRFRSIA